MERLKINTAWMLTLAVNYSYKTYINFVKIFTCHFHTLKFPLKISSGLKNVFMLDLTSSCSLSRHNAARGHDPVTDFTSQDFPLLRCWLMKEFTFCTHTGRHISSDWLYEWGNSGQYCARKKQEWAGGRVIWTRVSRHRPGPAVR